MPLIKKKFVLFDFDGVIVDTLALTLEIIHRRDPARTIKMIQKNLEGSLYDSPAFEQEYFGEFFSQYAKEILKLPVVAGMKQCLAKLAKSYKLIVVSSTIAAPISDYLDFHNLSRYFAEILGGDHEKSKTKKFQMVFEKYGITARDCVFVTDTLGDLREAQKAGVGSLAVTWGFHTVETLAKGAPAGFVRMPKELVDKVSLYFSRHCEPRRFSRGVAIPSIFRKRRDCFGRKAASQ